MPGALLDNTKKCMYIFLWGVGGGFLIYYYTTFINWSGTLPIIHFVHTIVIVIIVIIVIVIIVML